MWFQRLASQICFQALVGFLRPTTDDETLNKDPKWLFELTRGIFSNMDLFIAINTAIFGLYKLKHPTQAAHQSLETH